MAVQVGPWWKVGTMSRCIECSKLIPAGTVCESCFGFPDRPPTMTATDRMIAREESALRLKAKRGEPIEGALICESGKRTPLK